MKAGLERLSGKGTEDSREIDWGIEQQDRDLSLSSSIQFRMARISGRVVGR